MKKWIKRLLVVAVVSVITGSIMCIASFAMGGRIDFKRSRATRIPARSDMVQSESLTPEDNTAQKLPQEQADTESLTQVSQPILDELELTVSNGEVQLITDDTVDQICIDSLHNGYDFHQKTEGNTCKIEIGLKKNLPKTEKGASFGQLAAIIKIPSDYTFHNVEFDVKAGSVDADGIVTDRLELDVNAGKLAVRNSETWELSGDCKAGELVYQGSVYANMEADCSVGKIDYTISGQEEDFNYELDVHAGSITINGTSYGAVTRETTLTYTDAEKYAELDCNAGVIHVSFE